MKILLIDNYDSFTMNLAQLLKEAGVREVITLKNDEDESLAYQEAQGIIISPGPDIPSRSGNCLSLIKKWGGKKPLLGVCLGHQAIAEAFGGKIFKLESVRHGVKIPIFTSSDEPLFKGLSYPFEGGLYHSWAVSNDGFPESLKVTAHSEEGVIMAIRHQVHNIVGVQFHPESYLTPDGPQMMRNWLSTLT